MRLKTTSSIAAAALALAACAGGEKTEAPAAQQPAAEAPAAPAAPAAPVEEPTGAPGTIKITVAFDGKAPTMGPIDRKADPYCNKTKMNDESVMVNKNNTLKNAVVKVDGKVKGTFTAPAEPLKITQDKCMYRPRISTAMAGQKIEIVNGDSTLHNVHAYKGEAEQNWFNSAQPPNAPAITKDVGDEGMIRLKCDVHPWMSSWIATADHPFVAVTGDDGSVTLSNVPSRSKPYKIKTWHEKYGMKEVEVTVAPGATAEATVTYSAADQKG
jgi:plastocyanin